jgi:hypothetical protein
MRRTALPDGQFARSDRAVATLGNGMIAPAPRRKFARLFNGEAASSKSAQRFCFRFSE